MRKSHHRALSCATGCVLMLAIVLRIIAAFQPLWLDEIWSIAFTESIHHPWDVFRIHHLNNHPLNTLYLWMIGMGRSPVLYRIPSLIAGIALPVWITFDMRRENPRRGLIAAILIGLSLPILQTATEARGYAPMLLFAYGAVRFYRSHRTSGCLHHLLLYVVLSSFAIVLHMSAVSIVLALATALIIERAWSGRLLSGMLQTCIHHSVPLAVFVALALLTLTSAFTTLGRDPGLSFPAFVLSIFGWTALPGPVATVVAYGALVAVIVACDIVARRDVFLGVFLFVQIIAAPIILLLFGIKALGLEVRFFLPSLLIFLIAIAALADFGWITFGRIGRMLVVFVIGAMTIGQCFGVYDLLRYGRGLGNSLLPTLAWVDDHRGDDLQMIGTSHRIDRIMVEYLAFSEGILQGFAFGSATDNPQWLLERAQPMLRSGFESAYAPQYELVITPEVGKWWAVWKKRGDDTSLR